MDSLLADTRDPHELSELEPMPENYEDIVGPKRFSPEVCAAADELLATLGETFSLSAALEATAAKFGPNSPEVSYVSVLVPRWFELESDDDRIARPTGAAISAPGFFGDELRVTKGTAA
jgi:hypothetical protein